MINQIMRYTNSAKIPRFLKFCMVGGSGVLVNTGILILLYQYIHLPLIASSLAAISTAMLSNFLINDLWTFSDSNDGHTEKRALSFLLICSIGALMNIAILALMDHFGIWYILANLIGIAAATLWNYFANKKVTWGI